MQFFGGVGRGPRTDRLDSVGDLDHNHDPYLRSKGQMSRTTWVCTLARASDLVLLIFCSATHGRPSVNWQSISFFSFRYVLSYRIANGRRTVALSKRKVNRTWWFNLFAANIAPRDPNNSELVADLTFHLQVTRSSPSFACTVQYSSSAANSVILPSFQQRNASPVGCCVFMPAACTVWNFECLRQ